jgi:glutathione S-transferase
MIERHPLLYSFRRCPYAMRARMAIYQANIRCELREVDLNDKPESMLSLSNKGTVPVLVTQDNTVIDQSLDVMLWALTQNDPDNWLDENHSLRQNLIDGNDNEFKYYLDRYKYYVGYPEHPQEYYRNKTSDFLGLLEECLNNNQGVALTGNHLSFSDVSIFPFIRQFANVDIDWFKSSSYNLIKAWYNNIEQGKLFQLCMNKYEQWTPAQPPIYFPS